jgi:hypothetical protein
MYGEVSKDSWASDTKFCKVKPLRSYLDMEL